MPLGSGATCSGDISSVESAVLIDLSVGFVTGKYKKPAQARSRPASTRFAGFAFGAPRAGLPLGKSPRRVPMVWPLGAFLCPPGYKAPSGLRALARDAAVVAETARLVRRTARDRLPWTPDPAGPGDVDGQGPVVLVP